MRKTTGTKHRKARTETRGRGRSRRQTKPRWTCSRCGLVSFMLALLKPTQCPLCGAPQDIAGA